MTLLSTYRKSAILGMVLCVTWCAAAYAGEGKPLPVWWEQVADNARKNGYNLITFPELKSLYDSKADFILLDARPAYEFRSGHLPGAVNIEFHLGDRSKLDPEKAKALESLLGKDKGRLIVVYCRSFR